MPDPVSVRRERDTRIWRRHCSGMHATDIAVSEGLTAATVRKILKQYRVPVGSEDAENYRIAFIAQLDRLRQMMAELIETPPPPAFSNSGALLVDQRGVPVLDHSARIAATRTIADLISRQARILGVEAPAKVDVSMAVTTTASEAAQQAALAAQAYLEADNVIEGEVVSDSPGGAGGTGGS